MKPKAAPPSGPRRQPVARWFDARLWRAWLVRLTSRGLSTTYPPVLNQQVLLMNWAVLTLIPLSLMWAGVWAVLGQWVPAVIMTALCGDLILTLWYIGRDRARPQLLLWLLFGSLLLATWFVADYLGPETRAYILPGLLVVYSLLLVPMKQCSMLVPQVVLALVAVALTYFRPHIVSPPLELPPDWVEALQMGHLAMGAVLPLLALVYERLAHDRTTNRLLQVLDEQQNTLQELEEAQAQVQESHNQLQALLDGTEAILLLIDSQGYIVACNRVFERYARQIVGRDYFAGMSLFEHDTEEVRWFRPHFELALTGQTVNVIQTFTDVEGRELTLNVVLTPVSDVRGVVSQVTATALDITAVRRAEAERLATESRLQALIDNTDQGIWSVDRNYRLLALNRPFRQFLDSVRQQPVQLGDVVFEPFDPPTQHYWQMLYNRAFAGETFVVEWNFRQLGVLTELRLAPLYDQAGQIVGATVMAVDITARRAAERQLIEAKEQAEQASQIKSRFLAHISHDLRNPVHAMLGCIEVLTRTQLSAEQQPVLAMLERVGHRLRDNLDNLLDYSRLDAGRFVLDPAPFDLQGALADSVVLYELMARQQGLDFVALVPTLPQPWVYGDKTRLLRVLDNLVDNAIKYTDQGQVSLVVEAQAPDAEGQVALTFTVRDTGSGIPADHQKAIFEPFVQVDSSSKKIVQGIGLGLSIVKQLVELMQGQIHLASQVGQGTTISVSFKFPAVQQQAPDSLDDLRKQARRLDDVRVLVAEDDEANALYLQHFLFDLGWQVRLAPTGRHVLRALEREPFDLVIMDGAMPVMDGMEATERIRQLEREDPDRPRIPIVVLTGYARGEERDRFLSLGVQGFLTKPVQEAELLRTLLEVLRTPQAEHVA